MVNEVKLAGVSVPGIAERASTSHSKAPWIARFESCDIATVALLAALVGMSRAAHVAENLAVAGVPSLTENEYRDLYQRA